MTTFTQVHSRDLPLVQLSSRRDQSETIVQSINELGFLLVEQELLSRSEIDLALALSAEFFQLPQAQKDSVSSETATQRKFGNVGYYRYRQETAVGASEADLKEFIHFGRLLDPQHRLFSIYGSNPFFLRPPGFHHMLETLYSKFSVLAEETLERIARAVSLDCGYLKDLTRDGNSILRALHYPPVVNYESGAQRAAAHTGINLLGLQPRSTSHGLQFWTPRSEWIAIDDLPDNWLTVNIGEMLQYISGGRLIATRHRVANGLGTQVDQDDRYTVVFFFHPDPTKQLVGPAGQGEIDAGDWLLDRLRAIKMIPNETGARR